MSVLAALAVRPGVVVPLFLVCLFLVMAIPLAAQRGKLHIPGYAGMAIVAAGISLLVGWLAGLEGVRGTPWGTLVAVIFFLLIATALGSFLGLLFYRQPPEE